MAQVSIPYARRPISAAGRAAISAAAKKRWAMLRKKNKDVADLSGRTRKQRRADFKKREGQRMETRIKTAHETHVPLSDIPMRPERKPWGSKRDSENPVSVYKRTPVTGGSAFHQVEERLKELRALHHEMDIALRRLGV